jgi:hypothetical protein
LVVDYEIPMPRHTINGRRSMRSIADAVEALRRSGRLSDGSLAQLRTYAIRLPTGKITHIVIVIGPPREGQPSCGVALPSSNSFKARTGAGDLRTFEISRLDRAWVSNDGTVELSDGALLRAVNVGPTSIIPNLTPLQKRIVYRTLALIPARRPRYRGPASLDLKFLDYSTLYGLKLPSLKEIQRQLYKDPKLREITHQTIANALGACGMRRPRSGPLAVRKRSRAP